MTTTFDRALATGDVVVTLTGSINAADNYWMFRTEADGIHGLSRLLGCALLMVMPDEGLEEALESLHDVLESYRAYEPPQPPRVIRSTGKLIRTSMRPDLVLE